MARLPYQVLVIMYMRGQDDVKYCIFERKSPKAQVQFIAGGGEGDETPLQAAAREVLEESGVCDAEFEQLISTAYIPTNIFSRAQRMLWGEDLFVIPEYSFGAEVKSDKISISNEHVACEWVSYDTALARLKWDSNKTSLYELNCKLLAYKKHIRA